MLLFFFFFYLCSVVHHEISAAHRVGTLGRRDPKVITAGVPHGEETKSVPPLVCKYRHKSRSNLAGSGTPSVMTDSDQHYFDTPFVC